MERKWVIAAFLDIREFRSWTYRAVTAPEVKSEFLEDFYGVLQCYVNRNIDRWSKYEGDGIITVKEFSPTDREHPEKVKEYLLSLRGLLRKAQKVIAECESPPPGVRMRIMDGYVYKMMVVDPNDPERKRVIPEYVDYCTNTLRGLLGVNPEIPCVATSGVVKSLGKTGSIFRMRSLKNPSCYPKGVNKEDVDGLEVLRF